MEANSEKMVEHQEAVITEEMMRGLTNRIGVEVPRRGRDLATAEAMEYFARGYGDINPLYRNHEYGKKTRWGSLIAPPMFMTLIGASKKKKLTKEERESGRGGALPGIHAFYSGDDLDFLQVIKPGDRITARSGLSGFVEKKSRFAGKAIHETHETVLRNQRDELVGIARMLVIRTERTAAQEAGKYHDITIHHYSEEEMKAIDADYEREEVRGANPRWWEDVNVGDELTPVVKGPYTALSFLSYEGGAGRAGSNWLSVHSVQYQHRKRHPAAWPMTPYGFPDSVTRLHWEHEYAHTAGLPLYYDYGGERIAWMAHLITNWMGDDGFLRKLDGQFRRFNYYGDTTWVKGKVTKKYNEDTAHFVDIEISCVNQRGETHAPGHATVILPSRVHGPVVLPAKLDRPITFD